MVEYRTERIDAINEIFSVVGMAPVSALEPGTQDTQIAEQLLDKEWRLVMTEGWWFNTENEFELVANTDGEFDVPDDWIRFDDLNRYSPRRLTTREQKVYDLYHNTFELGLDSLKLEPVIWLAWGDVPESAKSYIVARAARQFANGYGTPQQAESARANEIQAKQALMNHDVDQANFNLLDSEHAHAIQGLRGRGPWKLYGTRTSV